MCQSDRALPRVLVVTSWERVERARYGSRTYDKLVRLEFDQPKWWFEGEGVLDENETL